MLLDHQKIKGVVEWLLLHADRHSCFRFRLCGIDRIVYRVSRRRGDLLYIVSAEGKPVLAAASALIRGDHTHAVLSFLRILLGLIDPEFRTL